MTLKDKLRKAYPQTLYSSYDFEAPGDDVLVTVDCPEKVDFDNASERYVALYEFKRLVKVTKEIKVE
jgi:hypothetical protein